MSIQKNTKYDFSEIVERIRVFKGLENEYNVAELLGIKRTALYEQKRRNRIPFTELLDFTESEGLLFEWLLTGKGPQHHGFMIVEEEMDYIAETIEIMQRVDRDTQCQIRCSAREKEMLAKMRERIKEEPA